MASFPNMFISNLLKQTGLFSESQIADLLTSVRMEEKGVTETVVEDGYADEGDFLKAVADVLGLEFLRVGGDAIEDEVLEHLPTKAVFQYNVIPLSVDNGTLVVAANDPFNTDLVDALSLASGKRIKLALSPADDIEKAAKTYYGVGAETVDAMIQDDRYEVDLDAEPGKVDLSEQDQDASIVKFVNQIIWEAFQQGATDIHVEPMEKSLRIRYRIDGVLHQTPVPAQLSRFQAAIISRIKVMANLDIAEKRLPMDGRIGLRIQSRDLDIRVSTMPTVYGESISLRLLQGSSEFIGLPELGMNERDAGLITKIINRPNGIVLVTGPTGSGKSTSLYAYLHEVNTIDVRILTAEEPIEYEMPGINQVLVRHDIGLTFARTLRSFLRQDPDIIMVGEIRDAETAEIAIQASLTGHLVFSTLHTNDAAGAFTRLLDMGVEPFLVASSCEAIVAQRLVRRLCDSCKQAEKPEAAALEELGIEAERAREATVWHPGTCETCRMTGFRGRVGIFEVLPVTDPIESMIIARRSTNEIKQQGIAEGMSTLRDDGWNKVLDGITTIEEVLRVTEDNE